MRVVALLLLSGSLLAPPIAAQEPSPALLASIALQLRADLELDDAQAVKLRELARVQGAAHSRATAAFLRAEADVIDAARGDDLVVRRAALERRAKLAIDSEMARLRWEKDVRALLTATQNTTLTARLNQTPDRSRQLWQAIVEPLPIVVPAGQPADSGEVRISVTPNYADIYLDGVKHGAGRKFFVLPVGKYELKFHAVGCSEIALPIEIVKGPPIVITQSLTCRN